MNRISPPLPIVQKTGESLEQPYQRAEELGGWLLEPIGEHPCDFAVLWTYHARVDEWDEEPRYSATLLEWEPEAREWVVSGYPVPEYDAQGAHHGTYRWRGYCVRFASEAPPPAARTWVGEQLLEEKRLDDARWGDR